MAGDYTVNDVIHLLFTTRAFATGIPTTLNGSPVVAAYEDDSTTQITSGIEVSTVHDSLSGLNLITATATTANGFESGKNYHLVVTSGTVDSVDVAGEVVGFFSLGRSAAILASATIADAVWDESAVGHVATQTMGGVVDAIHTDTQNIDTQVGTAGDGLTAIDLPNQTMDITGDITGNLSGSVGSVTGAVGSVTGAVGSVSGNVDGSVGDIDAALILASATVLTQASVALATSTYAEPGQEAPGDTISLKDKIGYLYKAWRNLSDQSSSLYQLYNSGGTQVDQKATVSDDTTLASKNQVESGP